MSEEDDHWLEEIRTVKPLKIKKPVVTSVIKLKKPVVSSHIMTPPAIRRLENQHPASPLPQKRLKQLRQQKIPVEASIDLHGLVISKAHQTVQRFLINAYRNELRCVEIITGKGNPLIGTGLLKREFPQWLADPSLRMIILHYEENPLSRGGSFLVMLRRNKSID